jgi:hypothetical protein
MTAIHLLPQTEHTDADHSFVGIPASTSTLFAGWGPRL